MKIIHYLHWLVGIILIFLHGFFGAEFEFKEEIRKTEKLLHLSGTAKVRTEANASLTVVKSKALDNARKLLDSDPVLALAALRIEIEKSLKVIANKLDLPIKEKRSITEIIINLNRKEIFSYEQVKILRKIIQMCNKAIHGAVISKGEAKEIIFLTEKFYRTLENSILIDNKK